MRRHNKAFSFSLKRKWRKWWLKEGTVNCLTVPFGFRKGKCKTQVSNRPQNTLRKIYRVFAAVDSSYTTCSTGRHTCTIFLPTSLQDCLNSGNIFSFYFPQIYHHKLFILFGWKKHTLFLFVCVRFHLTKYENYNDNQLHQGAIKTANWNWSFGFSHNTIVLHMNPIDAKC